MKMNNQLKRISFNKESDIHHSYINNVFIYNQIITV